MAMPVVNIGPMDVVVGMGTMCVLVNVLTGPWRFVSVLVVAENVVRMQVRMSEFFVRMHM